LPANVVKTEKVASARRETAIDNIIITKQCYSLKERNSEDNKRAA